MNRIPNTLLALTILVGAGSALAQHDDHGNAFDTASLLNFGIAVPGYVSEYDEDGVHDLENGFSMPGPDVDYFRIDLQGQATVELRTTMDVDTVGTLYDGEGEEIVTHDDISPAAANYNFRIKEDLKGGVYYLKVAGYNEEVSGRYNVLARIERAGDDHGDTFIASSLLPISGNRLAGSLNDEDDVDWFRVDFPVTVEASVSASSQNPISFDLYLSTDYGEVERYDDEKVRPFRTHTWHGTFHKGTYYFRVRGENATAYNVRVETEDTDSCESAPSSVAPIALDAL